MTGGLEDSGVANRRRQRCCGDRSDPWDRGQPLTHLVLPSLLGQPGIEFLDPAFRVAQMVDEPLENAPGQGRNPRILQVGDHGGQLRDLAGALRCDNAELGEVST